MAGISDISSDEISEHEAEIGPAAAPTARSAPALLVPRPPRHQPPPPHYHHSNAGSVSSESESDVRPHHRHQLLQPPRPPPPLPSSSSGPGAAPPPAIAARSAGNATPAATRGGQEQQQHPTGTQVNFQLVPCKACAASSSFAHCLSAKSKNGERHVPRLRLVKGQALRKRCKSLLVRGQRDDLPTRTSLMGVAPEPEDGWTEALPLTPENLALRYVKDRTGITGRERERDDTNVLLQCVRPKTQRVDSCGMMTHMLHCSIMDVPSNIKYDTALEVLQHVIKQIRIM